MRAVVEAAGISGWATNDELLRAAIDLLASNYVRLRFPRVYFLMQVVNFTEETTSVYGDGRNSYGRFVTGLGHVFTFVLGPLDTWNVHLQDEDDALRQSNRSWQVLASTVRVLEAARRRRCAVRRGHRAGPARLRRPDRRRPRARAHADAEIRAHE